MAVTLGEAEMEAPDERVDVGEGSTLGTTVAVAELEAVSVVDEVPEAVALGDAVMVREGVGVSGRAGTPAKLRYSLPLADCATHDHDSMAGLNMTTKFPEIDASNAVVAYTMNCPAALVEAATERMPRKFCCTVFQRQAAWRRGRWMWVRVWAWGVVNDIRH